MAAPGSRVADGSTCAGEHTRLGLKAMSRRGSLPLDDGRLFLTDGGMETDLIFHQGIDLPSFATFPLLEREEGRQALRGYFEPFLELARTRGTGFVLGSCTWRANADWGAELGYDDGAGGGQPSRGRVHRGAACEG